jgi:hypothetical protein
MCTSCGCGKLNDDHGDSRHITLQDLDQAAQAAGTTRESVVQNIAQGVQSSSGQGMASAQTGRGDYYQSSVERQSGQQPGEVSSKQDQTSSSIWQEGSQVGDTGQADVDNPQINP